MKLMMKIISFVLTLTLVVCLCACGNNTDAKESTGDSQTSESSAFTTDPTESVNHGGSETEPSDVQTQVQDGYTVTLLDMDEDPVKNAWLQMRLIDGTIVHAMTDTYGVAVFDVPEGTYEVSIVVTPDDYEYSPDEKYSFEDGTKELTIHIVCTRIKA